MKKIIGVLRIPLMTIFVLAWGVTTLSFANDGLQRRHHRRGNYSVAEPAAIALLGAGLVSLGIYVKKKRGKKQ